MARTDSDSWEPAAELRTVAVDLRDDWPATLRAHGFDVTAPSAWSAEGLLMYLPPEAQDRLLDHITERGWQVHTRKRADVFADYGRTWPVDETVTLKDCVAVTAIRD